MHGIVFAELVVFLENASSDKNNLLSSDSGTLLNCIRTDWSILESLWIAEFITPDYRTGLWLNFPSLGLIEREEHASHISEEHWVSPEKGLWSRQWCYASSPSCRGSAQRNVWEKLTGHSRLIARRMLYHLHSWLWSIWFLMDRISNTEQSTQLFQCTSCWYSTVSNMQGKSQQAQYTTTSSTSMAHSWWPGSRSCRVESRSSKPKTHLPSTVALRTKNFNVPVVQGPIRLTNFLATAAAAEKEEDGWLNLVKAAIKN